MTFTAAARAKISFGKMVPVPNSMKTFTQAAKSKEYLRITKLVRPTEEVVIDKSRQFPCNLVTTNEAARVLRTTSPIFPSLHFQDGDLTEFENNYLRLVTIAELRPVIVLGSKTPRAVEAVIRLKEGLAELMEDNQDALGEMLVDITVRSFSEINQRRVDKMSITFPCTMESLGIMPPEIRQTKVVNLPGTYITIRGERSANFGAGGG